MQEWITNTMNSLGYIGIGLLMFLENLFPPIPSELIMPLAGYTATFPNTQIQVIPAIAAGVIGTILGAIPWYYAGLLLGKTLRNRQIGFKSMAQRRFYSVVWCLVFAL
jgi:membrane protein DedA with SNARE-associated domain